MSSPLDLAVNRLRRSRPEMSAFRTLSKSQARWGLGIVAVTVVAFIVVPLPTWIVIILLCTAVYLVVLGYGLVTSQ